MPIHDWKRVRISGLIHHFHQMGIARLCDALKGGVLPRGYFALAEQKASRLEPDLLALHLPTGPAVGDGPSGGIAVAKARPRVRLVSRREDDATAYAAKADRIAIRGGEAILGAVIEIVSPGNRSSDLARRSFVRKAADVIDEGVNVLIVDLFPPTSRDPSGLLKVIWDEIDEKPFAFPVGKDRILASHEMGDERVAYVEPVAVGDEMPDMPVFLAAGVHVLVPVESTYRATWDASPEEMRIAVETGRLPDPDAD